MSHISDDRGNDRAFANRLEFRIMSSLPDPIAKYCGPHYYGEQDENGTDLSLIRENLRLSPMERVRKADMARRQTLVLMEYARRNREERLRANR